MGTSLVIIDRLTALASEQAQAELIGAASAVGAPLVIIPRDVADTAALGRAGAAEVVLAPESTEGPAVLAAVAAELAARSAPAAVFTAATVDGREAAGRLAVLSDRPVLADVVGLESFGDGLATRHSVFGGVYDVSAATSGWAVVIPRPGAISNRAAAVVPAVTEHEPTAAPSAAVAILSDDPEPSTGSRPPLNLAKKVVAGGRGLGSRENFVLVENLADALGAAVGGSRVAVDEGYLPQAQQIGQTGWSVTPDLYIALGISGAVQHLSGMQTSRTIVAVNSDKDAPIFDVADFGVVGDVAGLVPQIVDVIKARSA